MLFVTSALPLRASPRAQPHAKHVQQQALKGCPVEGGEKLTGSEAMSMYEDGSTCARAGEKGLDRAALDVASAEQAPVPGITMPFAGPDATKGGEGEEVAQSFLDWVSFLRFWSKLFWDSWCSEGLFRGAVTRRRARPGARTSSASCLFRHRSPSRPQRLRSAAATTPLRRVPRSRPMFLRARQSKALSSGACCRAT